MDSIEIGQVVVYGLDIDGGTRCRHYHSELDIIALRFGCCGEYYSCYECHGALAGHAARPWPAARFDEPCVLCGSCGRQLTVAEYLGCEFKCPRCGAAFNPGCKAHYGLYFEARKGER